MPNEEQRTLRLQIAHVLFLDIVGYSKLRISQQTELVRELNEVVAATKEFAEADSEGKLVRLPTGDGMALVFRTSPEAPAQCALEISQILKAHPDIRLRMGIHSGPVNEVADVNQRANIAGAGINLAQRIMDCGDAGHILLSKHVAEDLEQYDHWQPCLHDLGECEVKHGVRVHVFNLHTDELGNSELPAKFKSALAAKKTSRNKLLRLTAITGALVILASLFALRLLRSGAPARLEGGAPATPSSEGLAGARPSVPNKSIAVLPFDNLSDDKANAYFADGIQDEILTRLAKIADLKVISRTSTQHYKSAPENLREIAKQLGVAHIVEGSVQKSIDSVRVNVQLIRAADDSHLWADTFDRRLTDVFSVESEVAKAIADQLGAKVTGREQQAMATKPTDVPAAYDAYLRGVAYDDRSFKTSANSMAAQKYLRQAVELDPKFALAWALLSRVDALDYISGTLERTPALRDEANRAAETALTLQPNLGEALYAKGYYHYGCLKDYDTALHYYELARQLLPNASQLPEGLAYIARRRGEWDQSDAYFKQAEQLDPRNASLLEQSALLHIALRRFVEAEREVDEAFAIEPDHTEVNVDKAEIAQAKGDIVRAASILATLQIPPTNGAGMHTEIRQRLFEKKPAELVARLQDALAHADPALQRLNAEFRFWLGWAQKLVGDETGARQTWTRTRDDLEALLKEQPENSWLLADLALTYMGLGDKPAALQFAQRGIDANPAKKDALLGPAQIEVLARIAAQTDEHDQAIALIEKLLVTPYGSWTTRSPLTPAILRLDPMFDPLRNDPRFQKLCEEKQDKELR